MIALSEGSGHAWRKRPEKGIYDSTIGLRPVQVDPQPFRPPGLGYHNNHTEGLIHRSLRNEPVFLVPEVMMVQQVLHTGYGTIFIAASAAALGDTVSNRCLYGT